jgi:hypothetical protein
MSGSKRAAMSGGSTPLSKQFRCAWVPWYVEWFNRFFFLSICTLFDWIFSLFSTSALAGRLLQTDPGTGVLPVLVEPKMLLSVVTPRTHQQPFNGTPVLETVPKMDMTTAVGATTSATVSEATTRGHIATTSLTVRVSQTAVATTSVAIGDDAPEEPKVIMGHPDLRPPGQAFVPEVVDTTLFALQQAWDV